MKQVLVGKAEIKAPAVVVGCMRLTGLDNSGAQELIGTAMELGCNWFDHADIYGNGECHKIFAKAVKEMGIPRDKMMLQSKCGIRRGKGYDSSRRHIEASVENILRELDTDHLDMLLLHRPDALLEPEEVAEAFMRLEQSGKVRGFGVSNYRGGTIRLLQSAVRQPLLVNQLQFSVAHAGLVRGNIEANMETAGAADLDGGVLDLCRLERITIQAWSPFQYGKFAGCFIDDPKFGPLNEAMADIAAEYGVTKTAVAAAWVLRHPAKMQLVAGTTRPQRLKEICRGADVELTREEWYRLYRAAGNILP